MEESKSNIIDNRLFFKGQMNLDNAPEYQENGTYGEAYNINPVNYNGNWAGTLTNVRGNTLIDYTFEGLTSDPFIRVIGSKLDLKRRRVYWFVYGQNIASDQYAYVLYYSYETGDITTVFSHENILDFDPDFTISDIDIVYDDELGDTLFWTDGNSEPKRLNVDASVNRFNNYTQETSGFEVGDIVFASTNNGISGVFQFIPCQCTAATNDFPSYNFTTGELSTTDFETLPVGQCYPPFLVNTMFYQKSPSPYWSPNATYRYDTGSEEVEGVASFLRRKSYQFAYAYVYFDGQRSELSPFSEAVFSQELTSGVYTIDSETANPDFPTPVAIKVKVPIHSYRYSDVEDIESITEMPHAMIARVQLFIREVPTRQTPTDWRLWEDIPYDEFYKYSLSDSNVSEGFPVAGDAGTYYYDWFQKSYSLAPSSRTSALTTITVEFNGTQTLLPVDVKYASTNVYAAPKKAGSQAIIDNRMVFGGVTDGMDVSKTVVESIEDNISIARRTLNPDISADPSETELNSYNAAPTSTSVTGTLPNETVTIVYDLASALNVNDFDTTLTYDFDLYFSLTINGFPFEDQPNFSGTTNGIPDDFATFQEFVEDIFADYQFPISSDTTFTVDNVTGELTIEIDVTSTGGVSAVDSEFRNNNGFVSFATYLPYRTYKNHSQQQFGFVLRDDAGRQTPVITGDWATLDFPHFYDDSGSDILVQTFLARIGNIADISVPTEARVLDIVRKRSSSYSNYIQFCLSQTNCPSGDWNHTAAYQVGYVNLSLDDQEPEGGISNKNLYITLNSVNGGDGRAYESEFNTSILNFLPSNGDVVRFLYRLNASSEVVEVYEATFNIDLYDERTNTIVLNFDDIETNEPNLAAYFEENPNPDDDFDVRILCEVFQKPQESDQDFYWEVAAQLSCTNGSVDILSDRDRIEIFGDAYLKLRGYCINYDANEGDTFQNFVLQDPNYNDFAPSNNVGEGRPNLAVRSLRRGQNEYVETTRDNLIRYSEQSIQNTDVRRYGVFYDENIQEVDNIYGRIESLDAEGDELNIYQEDKISRVFVGRAITTELSGAERVIASQNNVFSDVVYNNFDGGISIDGDSFAKSGYQKFFTDSKRGKVYRQSQDGITEISEVGLSGYFKTIFRELRNSFTTPIIRGAIDERRDEYILSLTYSKAFRVEVFDASPLRFSFNKPDAGVDYTAFGDDQEILIDTSIGDKYAPTAFTVFLNETSEGVVTVDQKPTGDDPEDGDIIEVSYPVNVTLIWSERTKGWVTFLSMTPEWLESGIQSYHSFFNGDMYLHDLNNTDYNTFFGTSYDSTVTVYGNKLPEIVKYWRNIAVKTKAENIRVEDGDILTSEEQVSQIPAAIFENREGTRHAYFLGEGTGTEVNTGNKLRGRWVRVKLTLPTDASDNTEFKLFGVAFISGESGLTY